MGLTLSQKKFYEANGFLVIPDFVSTENCASLIDHTQKLLNQFDPGEIKTIFSTQNQMHAKSDYFLDSGDKIRFFFEEEAMDEMGHLQYEKNLCVNKIGHALHDLDPVFNQFSRASRIAELIHDLGVINPLLVQSMYIFKQPRIGGKVNCHQDSSFLYVEGEPVVGLWFALQDATVDNGCLWVLPGGHQSKLKSRFFRKGSQTFTQIYDDTPWPISDMQALPVSRGSVVVLHGMLPHLSHPNLSAQSRHAYTLHVMSGNGQYSPQNWLQRERFWGF